MPFLFLSLSKNNWDMFLLTTNIQSPDKNKHQKILRTSTGSMTTNVISTHKGIYRIVLIRHHFKHNSSFLWFFQDSKIHAHISRFRNPATGAPTIIPLSCHSGIRLEVLRHPSAIAQIYTTSDIVPHRYMTPLRETYNVKKLDWVK